MAARSTSSGAVAAPGRISPVVALDIGGVWIDLRPHDCSRHLGYECMEELISACPEILDAIREVETGRIDEEEYVRRIAAEVLPGRTVVQIRDAWFRLLGPEKEGLSDLVHEMVGMGFQPVFFSDTSPFHLRCVGQILSFMPLIRGQVVSFEVGAMKPEAAMYEAMEREFCDGGVPALYLDDREPNVEAALMRGWNARLFVDVADSREALRALRPYSYATS